MNCRTQKLLSKFLNVFRGYDGKLLAGVLPVALFASGHTFYVQDLASRMGLEAYVAHNTFQFAGTEGKRHRFRERGIWLAVSLLSMRANFMTTAFPSYIFVLGLPTPATL